MVKVGITGGIGSGKTTVCRQWEKLGAVVVYADDLAKKLMVQDEKLISRLRSAFGDQTYNSDGTLNRYYLSGEAFKKGRVNELNRLVHPVVIRKVKDLIEKSEAQGAEMFVEEAALLLLNGRPSIFDFVVLVSADKEKRIDWVSGRDDVSREEILARMNKQKTHEELIPFCDFVIENNSTLSDLKKKAADLYRQMLKLHRPGID